VAKALGVLAGADRVFALAELALKHAMARKKPAAVPKPPAAVAESSASSEDDDE
jgi:hypothetical protein